MINLQGSKMIPGRRLKGKKSWSTSFRPQERTNTLTKYFHRFSSNSKNKILILSFHAEILTRVALKFNTNKSSDLSTNIRSTEERDNDLSELNRTISNTGTQALDMISDRGVKLITWLTVTGAACILLAGPYLGHKPCRVGSSLDMWTSP